MHISINTEDGLTDTDKAVLRALLGEETAAPAKAAAPAPAKKAAAPKATKAKAEPEPDEDEVADDAAEDSGTSLEDAVKLATKMVSNGEAAKVKAALGEVGAKKVSEIPEDKVDEFIAALS